MFTQTSVSFILSTPLFLLNTSFQEHPSISHFYFLLLPTTFLPFHFFFLFFFISFLFCIPKMFPHLSSSFFRRCFIFFPFQTKIAKPCYLSLSLSLASSLPTAQAHTHTHSRTTRAHTHASSLSLTLRFPSIPFKSQTQKSFFFNQKNFCPSKKAKNLKTKSFFCIFCQIWLNIFVCLTWW